MITHFIPNAETAEQHLSNVQFQLENVQGWLNHGQREQARIKAESLLASAQDLLAALEKETGGSK